jgi:zinc transport system substrate-binding protein
MSKSLLRFAHLSAGLKISATTAAALSASTALAEVPNVVTDIAPVHALVAQVMGDLGTPDLLVDPGSSPHSYAMRPSQAAALEKAQLVVWIGEPLTPWLHDPLETLAGTAQHLELLESDGTHTHNFRETAVFDHSEEADHDDHDHAHDDHKDHDHEKHGHEKDAHDDHGHADHEEHKHDDHAGHDDHGHEKHDDHDKHAEEGHAGHDHHDHDHEGVDPHAWLDPANGQIWLGTIAEALSALDPENATTYRENATAGQAELATLITEIEAQLEPVENGSFVVFHDAYQYFENRFHLKALGAIRLGDATDPSPARVAAIQTAVRNEGVTCAFSEPQLNPRLLQTVFDGMDIKTAALDPLGLNQPEGQARYAGLIRSLADEIEGCLK